MNEEKMREALKRIAAGGDSNSGYWAASLAKAALSATADQSDPSDASWVDAFDAINAGDAAAATSPAPADGARDALNVLLERCDTSDSRNYGTLSTGLVRHVAKQGLSGGNVRSDPPTSPWDDSWDDQPADFLVLVAIDNARNVLAEIYAKCSQKIGPYASQLQKANGELASARAMLSAAPKVTRG